FWARFRSGRKPKLDRLSDRLAEWVLTGDKFSPPRKAAPWRWYKPGTVTHAFRRVLGWVMSIATYLFLSLIAALMFWALFGTSLKGTSMPPPGGSRWAFLGGSPPFSWL